MLLYYFFWKKSIFDHPTIARVWFWPLNSKTGYLRPSNYQNRSLLAIRRFCRAVSLMWTPRGGGAHLSAILSPLSLSLSFLPPLSLLSPGPSARRPPAAAAAAAPAACAACCCRRPLLQQAPPPRRQPGEQGDIERRESEVTLTGGPHCRVASTLAKTALQNCRMAKCERF